MLHSDVQPPKVEIPFGYLVQDTTCPKAQHALWVGRDVRLRGTMEFTDCSLPLLHVTNIGQSTGPLPPCPGGFCQPGDPPPCP